MTQPFKVSKGPQGYLRRQNLGWVEEGDNFKNCHFLLGKDEKKAAERAVLLEKMWDTIVARWEKSKETPKPIWEIDTYAIAKAVARGETEIIVEVPENILSMAESMADGPEGFIGIWLEGLRQIFPFLQLRLAIPELAEEVEVRSTKIAESLEDEAEKTLDIARQIRGLASGQQLYQALDAYANFIREKYREKGRYLLTQIALIKQHRKDHPLSQLDGDMIETWLSYWCGRPKSYDSQNPLAFTTCRNVLIALRQFLRWLNRSTKFKWQLPYSFTFPRCKIARLPADMVKKRKYFKRHELTTIWKHAKPWDRAIILLALNCGFSKREIATLQTAEIVEKKDRPTHIKRIRTKTMVYGEWRLWPETLEALEYLKQFHDNKSLYVVLNQAGKPLTKGTKKGNENQTIKNHWDQIFKRIQESLNEGNKDRPENERLKLFKLPFKHLRKTGATYIRHLHIKYAAELASMYLSHGEKADSTDQLLPVYTARPWKKLHRALLILRQKLLPVFQSVDKPWEYKIQRVTPEKIERILNLFQQGLNHKQIADQVGLHWVTVGKYCRKLGTKNGEFQNPNSAPPASAQ